VGTPAYMAPEQAAGGPVDERGDLFSLGCVLYEMLTGSAPFAGRDVLSVLHKLANYQPPSPLQVVPALPAALSDLVMRLLARDPAARPPSARAAAAALWAIDQPLPA